MSTYLEGDETTSDGANEQRETERVKAPDEPSSALCLQRVAASIQTQEKEKNDCSHSATRILVTAPMGHPNGRTRRKDTHPMGRLM
jgi:hypothetical protein